MKIPDIIPVTDFRKDAAGVIKKLQDSPDPLVITQHGRAIAVLQSVDSYERSEHERELLRMLAVGDKEAANGEGRSLESVLKEADSMLKNGKR
jgi:prevent-host-death family protein